MAATIELRLQVDGISCGNCVNAVETAVQGVDGVVEASVQLDGTATVRVTSDDITELVVAAVEGAGKSVAIMNPAAAPAPAVGAPGLELVLPEPDPEPEPEPVLVLGDEDEDEDDGAGVGFGTRKGSLVNVGVDGSTPKEVRVFGGEAGAGAHAESLGLAATDELDDMAPEHAQMFHALLEPATDANAGPRFAAELAFDKFCETQFGVGVMGPVAQHLAAWVTLPLGYQSALRRYAILELMEKILDGAGSKAFASALRRHALVALEAVQGFHSSAEKVAERQGSDSALGIDAADHEVRVLRECAQAGVNPEPACCSPLSRG